MFPGFPGFSCLDKKDESAECHLLVLSSTIVQSHRAEGPLVQLGIIRNNAGNFLFTVGAEQTPKMFSF